jgi:hypothetical protein
MSSWIRRRLRRRLSGDYEVLAGVFVDMVAQFGPEAEER